MSVIASFILAMSCGLPAIVGIVRLRNISSNYHPFIWLMIAAFITELVTDLPIILYNNYSLMPFTYPFYFIIEVYLFLLFYTRNRILLLNFLAWLIPFSGIIIYLISYHFTKSLEKGVPNYCVICFALVISMLAIKMLSNEIFETKVPALKNPKILIAIGSIIFYLFFILSKIIIAFNYANSNANDIIFAIIQIANPISYLIYTWAILCIPSKTIAY